MLTFLVRHRPINTLVFIGECSSSRSKQRSLCEIWGQVIRIIGALTKTPFGIYPTGNTGGSSAWFFRSMPIPNDYRGSLSTVGKNHKNSKNERSIDIRSPPGIYSKVMVKRITLLFLLLTLASGVVSGTPLHASNDKMMKCCDKAKSKEQSPAAEATRLCCAVNCSESTPTSSFSYSPSSATIAKSVVEQIVALFPTKKAKALIVLPYLNRIPPQTFQPKYIQHHSLLI